MPAEKAAVCGVTIIRSKRKTAAIHVKPDGKVEFRAPMSMKEKDILRILQEKQAWIEKTKAKLSLRHSAAPAVVVTAEQLPALKELARQRILPMVARHAPLLAVVPTAVKFNFAKKRFGSCSGKNGLNFSAFLAVYPDELVEYVVVHELAHIREHNHGPRFWALVAAVLPDYKERQRRLKAFSLQLPE